MCRDSKSTLYIAVLVCMSHIGFMHSSASGQPFTSGQFLAEGDLWQSCDPITGLFCSVAERVERQVPRLGIKGDGRIEVFQSNFDLSNGNQWSTSHYFQSVVNGGFTLEYWWPQGSGYRSTPTIITNSGGFLDVFGEFADHTIMRSIQDPSTFYGFESVSSPRPGTFNGGVWSEPTVAVNNDGREQIFATDGNGEIFTAWQFSPGGAFSGWVDLGFQVMKDDLYGHMHPVIGKNADGRLELFTWGRDRAIWHAWQVCAGCGFTGWFSLSGVLTTIPAVITNADGTLAVFARGTDNAIWFIQQVCAGCGWSSWSSLNGSLRNTPTVILNADGRAEVFAKGGDDAIWHIWQSSPGVWCYSCWSSLGGSINDFPTVIKNADGRLEVFANDKNHNLMHIAQQSGGSWGSWHLYTDSALEAAPPPPPPPPPDPTGCRTDICEIEPS